MATAVAAGAAVAVAAVGGEWARKIVGVRFLGRLASPRGRRQESERAAGSQHTE